MRTLEDIQKTAEQRGWNLNPDAKVVENIIKVQNRNLLKFGEYYCPCKIKRIPQNICPCEEAAEEIETDGHCHCNLYFKK